MAQANGPVPEKFTVSFYDMDTSSKTKFVFSVRLGVRTKTMARMINRFSVKIGVPKGDLRFFYEGRRISIGDTVAALGMKDKDTVEVFREQAPYRDTV